jgi:hypothetical protein
MDLRKNESIRHFPSLSYMRPQIWMVFVMKYNSFIFMICCINVRIYTLYFMLCFQRRFVNIKFSKFIIFILFDMFAYYCYNVHVYNKPPSFKYIVLTGCGGLVVELLREVTSSCPAWIMATPSLRC